MDINVDVGTKLASMMERLAAQIGTTADKVFPWYVQQAYLEGWTTLVVIALFMLIAASSFALFFRKANFTDAGFNRYAAMSIASFVLGVVSLVAIPLEGIDAARKMINPNYYAMQALTRDIGRLTAR